MLVGIGGVALTSAVRGGTSQFDPKTVAGLQAWYKSDVGALDASNNVITVDNTKVQTWQDQSGNGKHLTNTTVATQPVWRNAANGINAVPAIYFSSSNLLTSGTIGLGASTIFAVQKLSATGIIYAHGPYATGDGQYVYTDINSTSYIRKGGSITGKDLTLGWALGNVLMQWNIRYAGTGATHTMRKNGVDQAVTVRQAGDPGTGVANNQLSLGSNNASGGPVTGFISEFLVYNVALAASDIANIEGYLKKKWGTP